MERLQQVVRELSALHKLGLKISSSLSSDVVISSAIKEIADVVEPDLSLIYLLNGDDLVLKNAWPAAEQFNTVGPEVKHVGECLCGRQGRAEWSIPEISTRTLSAHTTTAKKQVFSHLQRFPYSEDRA